MKSIIIYFSQTGSTREVAKSIGDAIREYTGQCDIVRLSEVDIEALRSYDLIGLGCPTFLHREPLNVTGFIRRLGHLKGKHCFVFATHGGHPVNVLPGMAGKLRRQGLKVIGGFNCDGEDRMPHYTYPWFTSGHPDQVDLKAAADFGKDMVERIEKIYRGERVALPRFHWLRNPLQEQHRRKSKVNKPRSRGFDIIMTWHRNKCRYPKCRLCVDNCPVAAIDLSADPVKFRKGCISCYFCEMLCPTGAIEADLESVASRRKGRIENFIQRKYPEFFERAKTELIDNRCTLYRMLVSKVEIGNIEGMYGKAYSKRPRYVIRKND